MTSHIKQQLVDIRKSLEKASHDGNPKDHAEQVSDELTALGSIVMTVDLIRESKLGKVIAGIKDKYDSVSPSVAAKAKDILVHWKKIMEDHQKSAQAPVKAAQAASAKPDALVAKFNVSTFPTGGEGNVKDYISNLSPIRCAIAKVFIGCFSAVTSGPNADMIGASIEKELDLVFPGDAVVSSKQYSARAKLLSFNIKKNPVLRDNILNGGITHKELIHLSSIEMASQEQKSAREKMNLDNIDERRLDWLAEHKEDIQKDNGIDPANSWIYDDGEDGMSEPDTDPPDI